MKRRDFICGTACVLAGYALAEMKNTYFSGSQYKETPIPKFEVATTFNCNLNCKGCDTFSPLAKPEFLTSEQLTQDFLKLKELYKTDILNTEFMGGEPLLNPELLKLIEQTCKIFPKGKKSIRTNGLLLDQQDEHFWKTLKKYNIDIGISLYPIDVDRKKYEQIIKKYGIILKYNVIESRKIYSLKTKQVINDDFRQHGYTWGKSVLDLSGKQNPEEKFNNCPHRGFRLYARGNLYACYVHGYLKSFTDYFKIDIPVTKDDYIKIADLKDSYQVVNFLNSPKPLCRYCKYCHNTCYGEKTPEWGFSERKITEWT